MWEKEIITLAMELIIQIVVYHHMGLWQSTCKRLVCHHINDELSPHIRWYTNILAMAVIMRALVILILAMVYRHNCFGNYHECDGLRYVPGLFIITLEMGSILPILVIIMRIAVIIIHAAGITKCIVVYHDTYNGLSNGCLKWCFITIDMGLIILVKDWPQLQRLSSHW